MPRATTSVLAIVAIGSVVAPHATAQTREPEIDRYRFVSDTAAGGLWVNPGAAGFNHRIIVVAHYTWERPRDKGWTTGQYLIGLQSGVLGFGYRHDEFNGAGEFAQGDAYTLTAGFAGDRMGLGISRTWRTVGPTEASWDVGGIVQASDQITAGLVWRDIGSPEVRDTTRESRLIGALTVSPRTSPLWIAGQIDYRTAGGDFRAFRIGGGTAIVDAVDALAVAEWDGDGDFLAFLIGVTIKQSTGSALGVARLGSDGDARAASLGVLADVGVRP